MLDNFRGDIRRRYATWSERNTASEGVLASNLAATVAWCAFALLMLIAAFQLARNPITPIGSSGQTVVVAPIIIDTTPGSNNPLTDPNSRNKQYQNDTPFYNSRPATKDALAVVVNNGCYTKYQSFQVEIYGLTPYGNFWAQTDWNHNGSFGYGDGGYADGNGRATYTWDCIDYAGGVITEIAPGDYALHITDATTGFSKTVYLPNYDPNAIYSGGK